MMDINFSDKNVLKETIEEEIEKAMKGLEWIKQNLEIKGKIKDFILNIDIRDVPEDYLSNVLTLQKLIEFGKIKIDEYLNYKVNKDKEIDNERLALRDEVLYLTKGRNKDWDSASELLVNYILKHNHIYTTKEDKNNEVWIYKEGVYVPQGRSEIKFILRKVMGEFYTSYLYNKVMEKIEPDTYINPKEFFNINYVDEIPVENGILNVITRELKPFDPKRIFFNKLPVKYDPEAKCPKIEKFLNDVLAKEEDKLVFFELVGFTLLKEYKFEKAFMFVGNGRNGKDKTLELIKRLLGVENCCSVPIQAIVPDSFILSEFHNKMVNLAGEISNRDLKETSMFKGMTGRSIITAKRKFLSAIQYVNFAKFIFACNELPMVYDNSKGFWDRWVLLEFPYTFVPKAEYDKAEDKSKLKIRDEDIIEKITTPSELSGLLNKALDGLARLLSNRDFSTTQGSSEIKDTWIRRSNSVLAFALSNIEEDYESFIPKKQFRQRYAKYCKEHKITPRSDKVIKRTLQDLFGASESKRDVPVMGYVNVWEGIKWKS